MGAARRAFAASARAAGRDAIAGRAATLAEVVDARDRRPDHVPSRVATTRRAAGARRRAPAALETPLASALIAHARDVTKLMSHAYLSNLASDGAARVGVARPRATPTPTATAAQRRVSRGDVATETEMRSVGYGRAVSKVVSVLIHSRIAIPRMRAFGSHRFACRD